MFDNFGDESGELSDAVNVVLADFDTGKYFTGHLKSSPY